MLGKTGADCVDAGVAEAGGVGEAEGGRGVLDGSVPVGEGVRGVVVGSVPVGEGVRGVVVGGAPVGGGVAVEVGSAVSVGGFGRRVWVGGGVSVGAGGRVTVGCSRVCDEAGGATEPAHTPMLTKQAANRSKRQYVFMVPISGPLPHPGLGLWGGGEGKRWFGARDSAGVAERSAIPQERCVLAPRN